MRRRELAGLVGLGVTTLALPSAAHAASPSGPAVASGVLHLRWTITERRAADPDGGETNMQVADLELRSGATILGLEVVDTITNPGGNNPEEEGPGSVFDGTTITKWLDQDFCVDGTETTGESVLLIAFIAPVTFDSYRLFTANDFEFRDPVAWTLEVSSAATPTESDWVLAARQERLPSIVPVDRETATAWFDLSEL